MPRAVAPVAVTDLLRSTSGVWIVPESLTDGLTVVVNEYDRALSATRMEIVLRASDYLGKLIGTVARDTRTNDSHLQVAR